MPKLVQGSINEIRDKLLKATEKKMVALELYSEIVGEYDKFNFDDEAIINDDGETIEIMIGDGTTVCVEDGTIVVDYDSQDGETVGHLEFMIPINDDVVKNVIMTLTVLERFARR